MSLQQLVDYFNDRFAQEQGFDFRPFILQNGAVSGLFGKNQLHSLLIPVQNTIHPQFVIGHSAKIVTTPHFFHQHQAFEVESLLSSEPTDPSLTANSIINFDRLCRTVHLLNSLAVSDANSLLFLEVDPRHILGIKYNHGAYFEEILLHCGLQTRNMVISLAASGIHTDHHEPLLNGLNNYRECGYKIALNIGHSISANRILNLISRLAPDYVGVTAPHETYANLSLNVSLIEALLHLKRLVSSLGGQTILQNIKQPHQSVSALQIGFDLIAGTKDKTTLELKSERVKPQSEANVSCYDVA